MGSLTSVQREIILGTILGDGTLRRKNERANALLEINHSAKAKPYVDWKFQQLRSLVITPPKERPGNGQRIAYRFTTRSLPSLTEIYHIFYKDGIKIVPRDLNLTPKTLAVWFMDDGSRCNQAFYLNTQQFSLEDQLYLRDILFSRFGLNARLNRDKKYFRLRLSNESTKVMQRIIKAHIIPFFHYKLTNDPVTTEAKAKTE